MTLNLLNQLPTGKNCAPDLRCGTRHTWLVPGQFPGLSGQVQGLLLRQVTFTKLYCRAIRCQAGGIVLNIFKNLSLSLRKLTTMTVSDLKLRIFREIDSLEKNKLEEFYGLLMNYINGKQDISDWDKLSESQKKGIFDAIDQIESGKGIPNKKVLDKFRKKYSHA